MQGTLKTQLQAAKVITNLIKICNDDHFKYIIDHGIIEPLCSLLIYDDYEIIIVVLKCLDYILVLSMPDIDAITDIIEECGGKYVFIYM